MKYVPAWIFGATLLAAGTAWADSPTGASHPTPATSGLGSEFGVSGTFSIVAADPDSGESGAAVASKFPAVGLVVPLARGGVGAFCTQHWHYPPWRTQAMELLAAGRSPAEVLATLTRDDPRSGMRQLAIVNAQGQTAVHQPTLADASSRWWGAASGRFYACQGNTLVGREVVDAMAKAYETTAGSLADRLMAALVAGDCAGGDHRGRLAAGIVVAKAGIDGPWLELRVDESDDAVLELAKRYVALDHDAQGAWAQAHLPWQHPCPERPIPAAPERK